MSLDFNITLQGATTSIREFRYPTLFTWRPFPIFEQNGRFFTTLYIKDLVSPKIPNMVPFYQSPTGTDATTNGRSPDRPVKTIFYAINTLGARYIRCAEGINRENGFKSGTVTGNGDVIIEGAGAGKTFFLQTPDVSPTWVLDSGTTYKTSVAGREVWNVADFKYFNQDGFRTRLLEAASLAACQATTGTYYAGSHAAGADVYINLSDGRVPDTDVYLLTNETVRLRMTTNYFYIEGCTFMGGLNALSLDANNVASTTAIGLVNKCHLLYARSNGYGGMLHNGVTWLNECIAYQNGNDGFNYTPSAAYTLSRQIETDCQGFKNGVHTTTSTCNGTSSHDSSNKIVLNGKYWGNKGPNCIEVDGSLSLYCGTEAFDSVGFNDNSTNDRADWGDFAVGSSNPKFTTMWLYSVKSKDTRLSFATPNPNDGSTLYYSDDSYALSPMQGNVLTYAFTDTNQMAVFTWPAFSSFIPRSKRGRATIAAGTSSIVVTDADVSTTSSILATIITNDTTAVLKNIVPASGSFTIRTSANVTGSTIVAYEIRNDFNG